MYQSTLDGANVWVLAEEPNWEQPVEVTAVLPSGVETSLSNREARRRYAATLRLRVKYRVLLQGTAARAFVGALRLIQDSVVVLPFWPVFDTWGDPPFVHSTIYGGLNVLIQPYNVSLPGSPYVTSIYRACAEPSGLSSSNYWYPALTGRLEAETRYEWINDDLLSADIVFTESSLFADGIQWAVTSINTLFFAPGSYTPSAPAWTTGPTWPLGPALGAGTRRDMMPFTPNWVNVVESATVKIDRENVGFRKKESVTFYPQSTARTSEIGWMLTSAVDIGRFMRWFQDHDSSIPFWCPLWSAQCRLSYAAAIADTTLYVDTTAGLKVGDWLYLDSGSNSEAVQVATIPNTFSITLVAGLVHAQNTMVQISGLVLCRVESPELSISYTAATFAEARLKVRELPPEYNAPTGEVIESTLGYLGGTAYLFELSQTYQGASITRYLTSFEGDLSWGGQAYTSADIALGELGRSTAVDSDKVEIMGQAYPGNPLIPIVTLQGEFPTTLRILRATYSPAGGVSAAAVIFQGEVSAAEVSGSVIKITATPGGRRFNQQYPRMLRGPSCSAALFFDGCSLNQADWKFTAATVGAVSGAYPFSISLNTLARVSGPAPTYTADYFAGGWVEYGAFADTQRRLIISSTSPVAGALTIKLSRPFTVAIAGASGVILYPGCDLQAATCKAKFNNYNNFRGQPFTPAANPSFVRSSGTSGGKK